MTRGRGHLPLALVLWLGSVTSVEGRLSAAMSQKGPVPTPMLGPRNAASGVLYLMSVHLRCSRPLPAGSIACEDRPRLVVLSADCL